MMYWCDYCGMAVEPERITRYELHGEVDTRNYEQWHSLHCPICHMEVTEEADYCDCGELKPRNRDLCEKCEENCNNAYDEAIDTLRHFVGDNAEDIFLTYIGNYKY